MSKLKMNFEEAAIIIEDLIELGNAKYGYLKVGRDTLNIDILFIEKYEKLKKALATETLENIDFQQLPRMKTLKDIIKSISDTESVNMNKNVRMAKATQAYKK